jgi:hypothetical protein
MMFQEIGSKGRFRGQQTRRTSLLI